MEIYKTYIFHPTRSMLNYYIFQIWDPHINSILKVPIYNLQATKQWASITFLHVPQNLMDTGAHIHALSIAHLISSSSTSVF